MNQTSKDHNKLFDKLAEVQYVCVTNTNEGALFLILIYWTWSV